MVGVWRDRAVVLAYYNDVKHSGGGQVIAQITVGTVPASLIDPPATPTYIRMDCGDDHYEVSVTKTSRLTTKSEYDTELTRSLAGKIATEVGCSAQ